MRLLIYFLLLTCFTNTIKSQTTLTANIKGTYIMNAGKKLYLIKLKGTVPKGRFKQKRKDGGFTIIVFGKWYLSHDTLTLDFNTGKYKKSVYILNNNVLTGIDNDKGVYNKQK